MPLRSQQALEQVVDAFADRVRPDLARLLHRLQRTLGERIVDERDGDRLADWMASREALVRNREAFLPAFVAELRRKCMDAYDHAPANGGGQAARDTMQPLRLLDNEIVDEDGALAGVAARHESRASHALMLLGQRFAVLLERPPIAAAELPVGPHAFGCLLRHAATETGLGLHARMALYHLHDMENAGPYEEAVKAIDALLDGAGILPGLTYVPLRPRVVPHHPERGRGPVHEPGPVSEVVAMRVVNETLDQLVPQGTLPEHRRPERGEAVAAMVRLVSRFGPDSAQWKRCQAIVGAVMASARQRKPPPPGTAEAIGGMLAELGYDPAECQRLSAVLAHLGVEAAARPAADEAETRRYQERLANLPDGALIGFTREDGVMRARLRRRAGQEGQVLLANEATASEAWVETATVARLMAQGHAWVVGQREETQ